MKITFFYSSIASLGIEYLSANLKKHGFETELVFSPLSMPVKGPKAQFFFFSEEEWAKKIIATNPDIIAFSSLTDWHPRNIALADIIKKLSPKIPIVFGGLHVSSVPEKVICEPSVDYICIGEGEEPLVELASAIKDNQPTDNIANIWSKKNKTIIKNDIRPLLQNLDERPFPDKDLFYGKPPAMFTSEYSIFSERGCPYNCSFCYNSLFKKMYGPGHRRPREINKVIEELQIAKEQYNIKKTIFLDDTFNYNHARMSNLLTQYKEKINIPYMCQLLAKYVSPDTVNVLQETGCRAIAMGLQTVDNHLRQNILHCPGSRKEIKEAIRLIKKTKMFLIVTVMHKIPFQTDTELKKTSIFLKQNPPDDIFLFGLRYYPKTAITDLAHKNKILSDKDIETIENCRQHIPLDYGLSGNDKRLLLLTILMGKWIPKKLLVYILRSKFYDKKIPAGNLIKFVQTRLEDICLIFLPFKYRHAWFSIFREINFMLYFMKLAAKNTIKRIIKK